MPPSRTNPARTLATLAAVALTATGCAAIEPLETTGAHEITTGLTSEAWCETGDPERLLEDGADLMGPHFSFSFMCHFSGTEVPEHVSEDAEELSELPQLIGGTELLVNQAAFEPTYKAEAGHDTVVAWIEAGEERIELDAPPANGGYIAITVPTGQDTVLWIEDEGRAQGLDFRTGERIDPVEPYYNGVSSGAVETDGFSYEEVSVLNSSKAYKLTCAGWSKVERATWLIDQGWAPEGTAFLKVELSWCDEFEDVLEWQLNPDAALIVHDGAELFGPTSWSETVTNDRILVTALFAIPADTAEPSVHFTPIGSLEALDGSDDYAFAETPEPTEWAVSFSDAA